MNEWIQAVSELSAAHAVTGPRQYTSLRETPSKASDRTVRRGRHESHSQRKGRKKRGRPRTRGHSHSVSWNTCSCTALLITGETAGPSELAHNAVSGGHEERGLLTRDSVFYSVNYSNVLLIKGTLLQFLLGFCPHANSLPYLQRNARWPELVLCPTLLGDCGQMTTAKQ